MTDSRQGKEWQNLRQADRWHLVFYLRVFDGSSRNILGHVVDISEEGMMLVCDNPVEMNEDYRLRMHLPRQVKDRDEIIFAATSRWCRKDSNPDFYLAGFQIHDLLPATREVIVNLIKQFSYNDKK